MRKLLLIIILCLCLPYLSDSQPQSKAPVTEEVRVVNVEVPVRVRYKGKLVDNLTREDFQLFENKKEQKINGFLVKRKKLKVQELDMKAGQTRRHKSRYIVLSFRVTHYDEYVKKGLNHLFDKILHEEDQLLVFLNNRSLFFKDLKDREAARLKVDKFLQEVSAKSLGQLLEYLRKVENEVSKHTFELAMRKNSAIINTHNLIKQYFEKFSVIWKDYKRKYLTPDIQKYLNFARLLKSIKKEKWVINFYQFQLFPNIMISSESMREIKSYVSAWQGSTVPEHVHFGRVIARKMAEIQRDLNMVNDFPAYEVAGLFHTVDATFHTIFMKTSVESLSQDLNYKVISTSLENSLRELTRQTGGEIIVSNKLDLALDKVSENEDIYYLLSYSPDDPYTKGTIKIKMKNRKFKADYIPEIRASVMTRMLTDGPPGVVRIKEFRMDARKLRLVVTNFFKQEKKNGKLTIHIRVKNDKGEAVFDQKKGIEAKEGEVKVNLSFSGIPAGKYDFMVNVEDIYTRKTATKFFSANLL